MNAVERGSLVRVENLTMRYTGAPKDSAPILRINQWEVGRGEQVVLLGPSGSGKTTLLHLLSGIRAPTAGRIAVDDEDISALPESRRDLWRSRTVGYVFQNYYLFSALTTLENTEMPLMFAGVAAAERRAMALQILERLDLSGKISSHPRQLSAGEKQRAVIARALVNRPRLVLADEPSAHLDAQRRRMLFELLRDLVDQNGSTLIVATHDPELANLFSKRAAMGQFR